jgi:serine/threonine-protein kinase
VERLPYQGGPIEYLARQRGPFGFERNCRLKLVPLHDADRRAAEAVAREAKVVLRLDHPSIVHVYDLFEHAGSLVLVMEHFSSLSLARLLELLAKQRKQLDESAVWHVAHRLFDALAHAHGVMDASGGSTPIVHSDVRPGNILIAADGRVRLAGYGFARLGDEEATAGGQIGHGLSYVAPEQVQGRSLSERVDTFSAAVIIWELLTGRSATPEGLADVERLRYLSVRELDALRALRRDVPPLVTTALDACLVVDPAERAIQAEEVAGCIAAAMDLRTGERALRDAVVSLGAMWEGLAAGDPSSSSAPRVGRSVPPPAVRRKPAFCVTPPPAVPGDALPAWDEITRVPEPPKTRVVDPPQRSPSATIVSRSEPPRPLAGSLAPYTASTEEEQPPKDVRPRRGAPSWVMALPLAMVVGIVTFATVGILAPSRTKAPAASQVPAVSVATLPTTAPVPAPPAPPARSAQPANPSPVAVRSAPVPGDRAVLVVQAPPEGWVYVQGAMAGKTGEPIETSCGKRFVRVGTEVDARGMHGVSWLSPGQGVLLRCGERLVVPATPR